MFYSHDILGRRGPLGFIWSMAHGKRLSKQKLMGISLSEICRQIMAPDVPHSLRLQGILIGGVALVFQRQQLYLLEDLHEMTRHVKDAASSPALADVAAFTSTLKRGKEHAKLQSITMADEELQLVGQTDMDGAFMMTVPDGMDLEENDMLLFLVPSVADLEVDFPHHNGVSIGQHQSNDRSNRKTLACSVMEGPPHASKGSPVPDAMENHHHLHDSGIPGMQLIGKAFGTSRCLKNSAELLGHGLGPNALPMNRMQLSRMMPRSDIAVDDEMFQPIGDELLDLMDGCPPLEESVAAPDTGTDMPEEHQEHPEDQAKKYKKTKNVRDVDEADIQITVAAKKYKKTVMSSKNVPDVDEADIQIRVAVYRQWTQDTSDLLRRRVSTQPQDPGFGLSHTASAAPSKALPGNMPAQSSVQACGQDPALQVVPCLELQKLYDFATGMEPEKQPNAGSRRKQSPDKQDQSNHRQPLLQLQNPTTDMSTMLLADCPASASNELVFVDNQTEFPENHHGMSEDIEVERLRAVGNTPGASDHLDAACLGMALGAGPGSAQVLVDAAARSHATTTTSNSSGMSPETESGLRAPKPRASRHSSSLAALSPIHDAPSDGMHYGEGMLEDLLPVIPETEGCFGADDLFDLGDHPGAAVAVSGGAPPASNPFSSLKAHMPSGVTQFTLLESSGPGTQANELISKSTLTVLEIFRRRLAAEQDQQQQQDDIISLMQNKAAPEILFFDLVKGIRRSEAVKLFYQVLVTHTTSFIQAKQSDPYGDIHISAGRLL